MIGDGGARGRRPARPRRPALPAAGAAARSRAACASTRSRAVDREIEIAPGVFFPAWTYNGTVPGPVHPRDRGRHPARALRERRLAPAHDPLPRHPPGEHGRRLRDRRAGRASSRTSSRRGPAGFHLYHCHSTPLKKHIHKGLYGAFIIDPTEPRPAGAGARDGDERLRHRRRRREQLLHRQRPQLLLRAATRSRSAARSSSGSTSRT